MEILNDTIPELEESFQVVLTRVMIVGNFSSLLTSSGISGSNHHQESISDNKPSLVPHGSQLNITIEENDFPHGLFVLTTDLLMPLPGDSRMIAISEPDKDQKSLRVNVYIERTKGTHFITINVFVLVTFQPEKAEDKFKWSGDFCDFS